MLMPRDHVTRISAASLIERGVEYGGDTFFLKESVGNKSRRRDFPWRQFGSIPALLRQKV